MASSGRHTAEIGGPCRTGGDPENRSILTVRQVLIVDDEPVFATSVQRHLRREGFFADVAYDGHTACRKVEEGACGGRPVDLVVTDVFVEGMDGVAFLQWVKKTHPGVSTIIVSAYGASRAMVEALRPNLDIADRKPAGPEAMMRLIRRIDVMRQARTTPGTSRILSCAGRAEEQHDGLR